MVLLCTVKTTSQDHTKLFYDMYPHTYILAVVIIMHVKCIYVMTSCNVMRTGDRIEKIHTPS